MVFSQLFQLRLEIVVMPLIFGLVEDDLDLRSAIVHNSMGGGIYIDQQLCFTPYRIRFYAFRVYRCKSLIHVIVGGVL